MAREGDDSSNDPELTWGDSSISSSTTPGHWTQLQYMSMTESEWKITVCRPTSCIVSIELDDDSDFYYV